MTDIEQSSLTRPEHLPKTGLAQTRGFRHAVDV
jgi:hypothetical protein